MEKSKSRKVNGYVKAVLKRDKLARKLAEAQSEVTIREAALKGGQLAEALRILGTAMDNEEFFASPIDEEEGGES